MPLPTDQDFRAFLDVDLDVPGFLALDDAELDNEAFKKAQQGARKGPLAKRAKAAAKLAEMLADVRSGPALDQVAASAFDQAERWHDALDVRVRALGMGGGWHPVHAGRLVGNIGHDLLKLAELDAAKTWFDRALTFDPCNPFVLCSLAEVALARGDLAVAFSLRDYLGALDLPADFCADFDELAAKAKRPKDVPTHAPDLAVLQPMSDVGFARYATASAFDRNGSDAVSFRGHAIAAAMRRELSVARLSADLAVAAPAGTGDGADGERERAWARGLAKVLNAAATGEALPSDPEQRNVALAKRGEAGLRLALLDPLPLVRLLAARDLGPDPLGDTLLATQAQIEDRRGIAYRHPQQTGLTATRVLRQRRIDAAGKRAPTVIPAEGADNPVFDGLAEGEAIAFWMAWDQPFDGEFPARFGAALQKASGRAAAKDPKAAIHQAVDPFSVGIFVLNAGNDPRGVCAALLAEMAGVGGASGAQALAPREAILARIVLSEKGGISHAIADPRMDVEDYEDDDERWAAAFDPAKKSPPSEPDGGLFMSVPGPKGNVPELRLMPLYFPDVRVVYGVPEIDGRERDARSTEVARALAEAIDVRFRGVGPAFFGKGADGRLMQEVDAIRAQGAQGRSGFGFGVDGLTADMVQFLPNTCRFREYELFSAARDVVLRLGLAPTIHWWRGRGTWIVNLWEKR